MKLATTPAQQRRWMKQWRKAAPALDEVRRRELANLTDQESRREAAMLLQIPNGWRDPNAVSGLVEQQALFRRLARK